MKVILLIMMMIVGCGSEEYLKATGKERPHRKIVQLNEFSSYIKMFEHDSLLYGDEVIVKDLIVGFGIIDEKSKEGNIILGKCFRSKNKTPQIVIDINEWEKLSSTKRKILMYHELGHCVLNRDHIEKYESIMNPIIISESLYKSDAGFFLSELFDPTAYNSWSLTEDNDDAH